MNYYNEIDSRAAAWLRALIERGLIAPGFVDERSITDVQPDDLMGFTQCHFFAGIGGWSYALRLAGWSDDKPVWTGSAPANPFLPQANIEAPLTSATSGPSSPDLSAHVDLQSSLANRLLQRLEGIGSPVYALTWKEWDMRSGPPICALRASALHKSDSESTLGPAEWTWLTPNANEDAAGSLRGKMQFMLTHQAKMRDAEGNQLGWQLNPNLARWLMGYPPKWCDCAVTAMQSFHRSRKRSSKHLPTP